MRTDVFGRNRLAVWAIVILATLNLMVVIVLWWTQTRQPSYPFPKGVPGPGGLGAMSILERELELTPDQAQQLRALWEQDFEEFHRLAQEMQECRRAMAGTFSEDKADDQEVRRLAERIGQNQTQLELTRRQHFEDIRALRDPSQRQRLEALVKEMSVLMPPGGLPPLPGLRVWSPGKHDPRWSEGNTAP